jgi:hypothetical protein
MKLPDISLAEPEDEFERLLRDLIGASLMESALMSKCVLLEMYLETGDDDLLERLKRIIKS